MWTKNALISRNHENKQNTCNVLLEYCNTGSVCQLKVNQCFFAIESSEIRVAHLVVSLIDDQDRLLSPVQ